MIPDRIKQRLVKDRRMTSITLRIPVDVVDSLKEVAPKTRHSGYQALLKSYISDGLRRDEAKFTFAPTQRLVQALKKRGVSAKVLDQALHGARRLCRPRAQRVNPVAEKALHLPVGQNPNQVGQGNVAFGDGEIRQQPDPQTGQQRLAQHLAVVGPEPARQGDADAFGGFLAA